ncbi:MAG: hypothetical protein SVR94_19990, partial [Pseudomonadota bacterium]|nr:hypothetical protein [Pseudomonadota bacterium]
RSKGRRTFPYGWATGRRSVCCSVQTMFLNDFDFEIDYGVFKGFTLLLFCAKSLYADLCKMFFIKL